MPLNKSNIIGNQQVQMIPQQNQGFQGQNVQEQEVIGGNPTWGAGSQNISGQGYAAPGYPPQGGIQQQLQQQIPQPQAQGYPYQKYSQGNWGQRQMPVQPAKEEPNKGGIKGFITNFIAKWKRFNH